MTYQLLTLFTFMAGLAVRLGPLPMHGYRGAHRARGTVHCGWCQQPLGRITRRGSVPDYTRAHTCP